MNFYQSANGEGHEYSDFNNESIQRIMLQQSIPITVGGESNQRLNFQGYHPQNEYLANESSEAMMSDD